MAATSPSVVQLAGVGLRYGKTVALADIQLDLPAQRMVGLIGPDGVGKSSLLALVSGARALQQGGLHPVQHCQPDGFLALEVLEHPPLGDANGLCQRGRGDFGGAVLCGQLQRSLHQLRLAVGGSVLGAWELGHGFW